MREELYPVPYSDRLQLAMSGLSGMSGEELRQNPKTNEIFERFKSFLNNGWIRAAEKGIDGNWHVNTWVKEGILVGFRLGTNEVMSQPDETLRFFDKDTYPLKHIDGIRDGIRVVPGGTSIRDGVYVGRGVTFMPPAYANVGAYIGRDTMIDSGALVGSCAQVGERCHIAANAQIGGVLEPINANSCIVEDDVIMGINTSIAEGVILRRGVVLAPGVQITSATPVYDVVREEVYTSENGPLTIPEGAVVVAGDRPLSTDSAFVRQHDLRVYAPIIRKYRDASTDAKTALESALR